MNNSEFSNEFDVLYNNVMSNKAPGLDEYEKSVFLTKAQKQIIRSYFDKMLDKTAEGFDGSVKRQYDFSSLIKNVTIPCVNQWLGSVFTGINKYDDRSFVYLSPIDMFLTINENIIDYTGKRYTVIPINFIEYSRLTSKPYGLPPKRQAWRLITSRQSEYNGIGVTNFKVSDASNLEQIVVQSIYNKPIKLIFNPNSESVAPNVVENKDNVIITCDIANSINGGAAYWNAYFRDENSLQKWEGNKYIKPLIRFRTQIDKTYIVYCPLAKLNNNQVSSPVFEIIGKFQIDNSNINDAYPQYQLRYVKIPKPIILVDLEDVNGGLSIDGHNKYTECELPNEIHEEILQRAVELAKVAYTDGTWQSQIAAGNQSATNLGINPSNSNNQSNR